MSNTSNESLLARLARLKEGAGSELAAAQPEHGQQAGAQVVVVIAETDDVGRRPRQAPVQRIDRIRTCVAEAVGVDVAACLEVAELPVDRRHNSKIDRRALADWAAGVLEGGPVRRP